MTHYSQLTLSQRIKIQILKAKNVAATAIAKQIKVHFSTVYRELSRFRKHTQGAEYEAVTAHETAMNKREIPRRPTVCTEENRIVIGAILAEPENGLNSPDVIAGRGKLTDLGLNGISTSSIYKIVENDRREGGKIYKNLPRGGRKYEKNRTGRRAASGLKVLEGQKLEDRPPAIEERKEPGHVEADLMFSGPTVWLTMIDRCTRQLWVRAFESKAAEEIQLEINLIVEKENIRTITFDRGLEWAKITAMVAELCSDPLNAYFCDPYSSFQKGSIENANRLLRKFWPKRKDIPWSEENKAEARRVEDLMNRTPRKVLGYKTPLEKLLEWTKGGLRKAWDETMKLAKPVGKSELAAQLSA